VSFLLEATFIGALGGLIGYGIGALITIIVNATSSRAVDAVPSDFPIDGVRAGIRDRAGRRRGHPSGLACGAAGPSHCPQESVMANLQLQNLTKH